MKAESDEEATEGKFKDSRDEFLGFRKRSNLHKIRVQGEWASADVGTAARRFN